MSLELRQVVQQYDQILDVVKSHLNREAALAATNDVLALVKLRIEKKGENFEGQSFSPYSSSYADFRQSQGSQTGYKDFSLTTRMLTNVTVKEVQITGERAILEITTLDEDEEREKLDGNSAREGVPILAPNRDEINLAAETYIEMLVSGIENKLR